MEMMFSILDTLFNLDVILRLFPARCQRHLLESTLLHKRLIMTSCQLREKIEIIWKLGSLKDKFVSFGSLIRYKMAEFISNVFQKIHLVIKQDLNAKVEPTSFTNLKRTVINIGFFCLSKPAVLYEDRDNPEKSSLYLNYGKDLLLWAMSFHDDRMFTVKDTL